MSTNSQLLKGLMDGVILKIINNKETYGYEIYETLQELGFVYFISVGRFIIYNFKNYTIH